MEERLSCEIVDGFDVSIFFHESHLGLGEFEVLSYLGHFDAIAFIVFGLDNDTAQRA